MLALSLTVLILLAISMAVNLHLRVFDGRRSFLEESQLSREVLRMVGDDIRSVVVPYEQDVSCIQSLLATGATGGSSSRRRDEPRRQHERRQHKRRQYERRQYERRQHQRGQHKRGSTSGGSSSSRDSGGSSSTGGSSNQSGTSGGQETSGSSSSATDDLLGDAEASANTENLSSTVTVPAKPGIYGNQYELQIDISRLPREDQYQPVVDTAAPMSIVDIPSDVKTVTYYVLGNNFAALSGVSSGVASGVSSGAATDLSQANSPLVVGHGLVRRQLDRSVTEWASFNSNVAGLEQEGEVIAPEVVGIEFQYFDGLEWRTEWDSEVEGKLPVAIQIFLAVGDPETVLSSTPASGMTGTGDENVRYYRSLVYLPLAEPTEEETSGTETMGL